METNRRSIFGVVLVILGLYFLLDNFYLIPFNLPWYVFTWQMLLIGIGIFNLVTGNRKSAFILMGIGILFLVPEFYPVSIGDFWPIVLIVIGVSFFLRNRNAPALSDSDEVVFDDVTVFGAKTKTLSTDGFENGKVTTIFGGTEIDLRNTTLIAGEAVIDTFTMFGGTEIFVPDDWTVKSNVTPIFGGMEDKRSNRGPQA